MDDKYLPNLKKRQQLVLTQIDECQTLIYRNNLENLTFKADKNRHKQTEVETNNTILKEKLDHLFKEWESLDAESQDSSNSAQPGLAVQSEL